MGNASDWGLRHNPVACGGDMGGRCCSDDPCSTCIDWAFGMLEEMQKALGGMVGAYHGVEIVDKAARDALKRYAEALKLPGVE
jgi:hypothetical protein